MSMDRNSIKKMRIVWILAATLTIVVLVYSSFSSRFDHDEVQHLHAAWLVEQGEIPFIDFLEQHHPTFWYIMAPLTDMIRSPKTLVFAGRMINLALILAFLCVFTLLIKNTYPGRDFKWAVLLLLSSFTFTRESLEIRPDPLMNLLSFAGIYFWIVFLKRGRWREAMLSGLFFGLAIAVLQKAVIISILTIIASIFIVIINACLKDARRAFIIARGIFLMIALCLSVLSVFFLVFAKAGYWEQFVFWNYTFNKYFYLYANVSEHFSVWITFLRSFAHNAFIWIAGLAGFCIAVWKLWGRREENKSVFDVKFLIIFMTIGYSVFLLRSRFPFSHYFIVLMPFLALLFCELESLAGGRFKTVIRLLILGMLVEMLSISMFYKSNADQLYVQNFILDNTSVEDRIFASPPYHPIYRKDGAYFWYNASMISSVVGKIDMPEPQRVMQLENYLWKKSPPVYVFFDKDKKGHDPYDWKERSVDYRETQISGLFELNE